MKRSATHQLPGGNFFPPWSWPVNMAYREEQRCAPFVNLGLVVLPEGDADYSNRWRRIKDGFSQAVAFPQYTAGERVSAKPRRQGLARHLAGEVLGTCNLQ